MGWGQLKDWLQPAWILGFHFFKVVSFPGLFPGLVFDTPFFGAGRVSLTHWGVPPPPLTCARKNLVKRSVSGLCVPDF